jgi:hypothetical protein
MFTVAISASVTLIPLASLFSSISHCTVRPVSVVVAAIWSTTATRLTSGFPRQVCVMWQTMRCSIPTFAGTCLVPLRGSPGILTDLDAQPGRIGQFLQLQLP